MNNSKREEEAAMIEMIKEKASEILELSREAVNCVETHSGKTAIKNIDMYVNFCMNSIRTAQKYL